MPRAAATRTPPKELSLPDATWLHTFRRRLLAWYRRHRRDLPWRRTRDPYCIWVSEIMLQQTQVATVIPYYERFLARFPDLPALAAADEHDVLRYWEGLGYYRRARQLHAAARQVVERHAGAFPDQLDDVRGLAGIGRYTAGAIVSIAFDRPAPILEANTIRLYSRLLGFRGDTSSRSGQDLLWGFAERLLPRSGAGTLNQALMELGSQVCTPRGPDCQHCPAVELCAARRLGMQNRIPTPKAKPTIEAVREAAVVVRQNGRILLRKHLVGQRWAGLWDFLRFALPADGRSDEAALLATEVERLSGLRIEPGSPLATLTHGVTRFRITLQCYTARRSGGRLRAADGAELKWVRPGELADYALSTTGRKIARLLVAAD